MIKQTNLIFKLPSINLEVYSLTTVGTPAPTLMRADPIASYKEEIYYVDDLSPLGEGPFDTIAIAMRHYNDRNAKQVQKHTQIGAPAAKLPSDLINVDFKAKKRVEVPIETL